LNLRRDELVKLLATKLPKQIAEGLADEFLQIRVDVATGTLGRASAGKFVENMVKALQYLDGKSFEAKPDVDGYLRKMDSSGANLDDGLKICASRVARSVYTLRNKRSIAHAGEVDPNSYDLQYLLYGAQWVLAELVRVIAGSSMKEAGRLVEAITAPVGGLVDDIGGRKVVHGELTAPEEILVLLHHHHPDTVATAEIRAALRRRDGSTIREAIRKLWLEKLIEGDLADGFQLTSRGYTRASELVIAATQ